MQNNVNFWSEMALETRNKIKQLEADADDAKSSLAAAIGRGDEASAKTWQLYLELKTLYLEDAKRTLMREVESEQLGDAAMFMEDQENEPGV